MLDLIDEQLGRLLFIAAIGFSVAVSVVGGSTEARFPDEETVKDASAVQVPLAAEQLLPVETYFPDQEAAFYKGSENFVFVKPKEVKQYEAIDLDVPPAAVMRPPGVLPSPGPSLEGTQDLPRWGEELPAPAAPSTDPKDTKTGSK